LTSKLENHERAVVGLRSFSHEGFKIAPDAIMDNGCRLVEMLPSHGIQSGEAEMFPASIFSFRDAV
jgi:hypothetical protein